MSDENLLDINPTSLDIIVSDEVVQDELAIESHVAAINDHLLHLLERTGNRLKFVTGKVKDRLTIKHSESISVILKHKDYTNIRHLVIPTIPGFTGRYLPLIDDLEAHNIVAEAELSVFRPAILYFQKLLSNPELFKTNSTKLLIDPKWKTIKWKEARTQISTHFQRHDNQSNRIFGEVFANLGEYDKSVHRTQALLAHVSGSTLERLTKLIDELDGVAQKAFMKYVSQPDFPVSKAVRGQAAGILREAASVSETIAFYAHVLTQTIVSLDNIKQHVKKKV